LTVFCFFAHHRSASSSTNDILRELSRHFGWRFITVHNAAMYDNDLQAFCAARRPDLLTLSNARRQHLDELPEFRGVHLVRDPRDVLVSSYFSHRDSHPTRLWPELEAHRRDLRAVDQEQGLLLEMDCRAQQFADLGAWQYDDPRVLEWRMEALVADPAAHFRQLLDFWGLATMEASGASAGLRANANRLLAALERRGPVDRLPRWHSGAVGTAELETALAKHSFRRKSGGRRAGQADTGHHYRSGAQGDWRQHFSRRVTEAFKERFGDLLVQLGYERGLDW
jgi:hypothetical protein